MTTRSTARVVGSLFVAQMVTASVGTALIQGSLDDGGPARPWLGVAFMLLAGFVVAAIGLLMYPILRPVHTRLARSYAVLRIVELAVSAGCCTYLLLRQEEVSSSLLWVYIPTGLGGLVLSHLLFVSRLVPRPVALLGLVGYACLTVGVPLDLLGVLDMSAGGGQALLLPGGLFEVAALPVWLILRGFAPIPATRTHHDATRSRAGRSSARRPTTA